MDSPDYNTVKWIVKAIVVCALPHSLAYSFVGIQTLVLATNYPSIYWNCACLITNSGGNEDAEEIEEENKEDCVSELEETEDIEEDTSKKKARNTNYGKISTAIGVMQKRGIQVSSPDINKSSFTFTPDVENNTIIYGIKGINRIGNDIVNEIINNRPYNGIEDFLSKVKVNKTQMVSLIKSGAFDKFFENRLEAMNYYINQICEKKERLTLQNMQTLINYNLIPEKLDLEKRIYNFNKYLKKNKNDIYYILDNTAFNFYSKLFDLDLLDISEEQTERNMAKILQKDWDKIYKKRMDTVRNYLKENKENILKELNDKIFKETWDKYCEGSISKWEMDSVSFYYHEHELENIQEDRYEIVNFFDLPEEPETERIINIKGKNINLLKLRRIAGTVLDKNKNKSSISLLTKYGVVTVKIYQGQFSRYDRQISMKMLDGKKKILERSWFTRGNKLMISGIRRGDNFIPKVYKNHRFEAPVELISNVNEDGTLELKSYRELEE